MLLQSPLTAKQSAGTYQVRERSYHRLHSIAAVHQLSDTWTCRLQAEPDMSIGPLQILTTILTL